MNPSEPQSSQDPSSPTDATARIGRGDFDRAADYGETGSKMKRAAARTMERARETASEAASSGRAAAAGKMGGYSDRLRATARSAEQEDPNIAHFAHNAADRLHAAADYVRNADLGQIRDDAADMARRHPALFMGGMFAAGLVIGNLAKTFTQSLREDAGEGEEMRNRDPLTAENDEALGEAMGGAADSFDAEPGHATH